MKLTFEITDRDLDIIKDSLKITQSDHDFISGRLGTHIPTSSTQEVYARRILRVRRALMLDNSPECCVMDYKPCPQ